MQANLPGRSSTCRSFTRVRLTRGVDFRPLFCRTAQPPRFGLFWFFLVLRSATGFKMTPRFLREDDRLPPLWVLPRAGSSANFPVLAGRGGMPTDGSDRFFGSPGIYRSKGRSRHRISTDLRGFAGPFCATRRFILMRAFCRCFDPPMPDDFDFIFVLPFALFGTCPRGA